MYWLRFFESAGNIKREAHGSHRILSRAGWPDTVFAFHDGEEIGPRMLARIAKKQDSHRAICKTAPMI